jgi:hypothetical protein
MWICGRLCEVMGFIEEDRSVGIGPAFIVEHVIPIEGMPFTAHELEWLHEDDNMMNAISNAAFEEQEMIERLRIPDHDWLEAEGEDWFNSIPH